MDETHAMDVIDFLQSAYRLKRRFAMLVNRRIGCGALPATSATSATGAIKPAEPPDTRLMSAASGRLIGAPADKRLFILSGMVYGGSAWSAMFCAAASTMEESLANECNAFLLDSVATVDELGLDAWLRSMVDDARQAVFTGVPSCRMPLLIRSMGDAKLVRQSRVRGSIPYGDRKLQGEAMLEHCDQTYRLAAHSLLQWGGGAPLNNDVAFALLVRPNIGAALLREHRSLRVGGAMRDVPVRRIARYLTCLNAQADRQYAWMRAKRRSFGLLPSDVAVLDRRAVGSGRTSTPMLESDRRYLFDARHVIAAYRNLWDSPMGRALPVGMAKALHASHDGSAKRDRAGRDIAGRDFADGGRAVSFRIGGSAQSAAVPDFVETMLASIGCGADPPDESLWRNPIHLRLTAESLLGAASAADLTDGFSARDRDRFEYGVACLERIAAIVRDEGLATVPTRLAPSICPHFGELKRLPMSERDRRLRSHARVESDMAAVMLARLSNPNVARQAGAALIRGDLTAYGTIVGAWRERLREQTRCVAFA
ncbi:hypothetical protein KIH79_07315 [Bifidobacterium sp. 82T10]|uniref:Uncharacterized protein n=1 Tax=Bifidobacterium miconis TaxID=2834435 RepID=A0ABS6WHP8_9BIFI|nr:hypothetical protein [Bifidobacterium miconis]MBW3092736.1 hypothetical protein [Bifidobacterium miconis]MBW3092751.1 hypothetical protein [Bifidobacterium miconis]